MIIEGLGKVEGRMNLFWPVYKRIEEDVLKIAETIFFDDDQLDVYSLSIADLLIRCVVEVEAISKELYLRLGGVEELVDADGKRRDLYFDTDCIKLIVDTWGINKKKIQITNPNMFFTAKKAVLTPLHKAHKRGTSSSKWQQAYQAVKHFRSKSIKKATVDNLLNALGALYILNLYYADESFWMETPIEGKREYAIESKIFTPFICDATNIRMSPEMGDVYKTKIQNPTLEESIYVKKYTEDAFEAIHTDMCRFDLSVQIRIKMSPEYKAVIQEHPELDKMSTPQIAQSIGMDYVNLITQESGKLGRTLVRYKEKEAVLVKDETVYPTLTYHDFLSSDEGIKFAEKVMNSMIK